MFYISFSHCMCVAWKKKIKSINNRKEKKITFESMKELKTPQFCFYLASRKSDLDSKKKFNNLNNFLPSKWVIRTNKRNIY
jgi:hypothetical protein